MTKFVKLNPWNEERIEQAPIKKEGRSGIIRCHLEKVLQIGLMKSFSSIEMFGGLV
jgi:hypothetical protein